MGIPMTLLAVQKQLHANTTTLQCCAIILCYCAASFCWHCTIIELLFCYAVAVTTTCCAVAVYMPLTCSSLLNEHIKFSVALAVTVTNLALGPANYWFCKLLFCCIGWLLSHWCCLAHMTIIALSLVDAVVSSATIGWLLPLVCCCHHCCWWVIVSL